MSNSASINPKIVVLLIHKLTLVVLIENGYY
jgi:hypothetical protein